MAEMTVQVTENMANFIGWANAKGQDEVMKMVRERLEKLKDFDEKNPHMADADGFKWDKALEPNDGVDQWKNGGDCNKCRKIDYCMTKCRANRLLKQITTPFLYQAYLEDCPEAAAKEAGKTLRPEDVLKMVNAQ